MKQVQKALTLLLALLMLLSLTACHGRLASDAGESEGTEISFEGESPVPERFDESKQIEISFWAKNDTNKTQIAIYQQAIDSFQKLYPNVSVKLRLYTDYGRI